MTYAWIPRKKNTDADALSNEAMDAVEANVTWSRQTSRFCVDNRISGVSTLAMADDDEQDEWDLESLSTAELRDLALAITDTLSRRR